MKKRIYSETIDDIGNDKNAEPSAKYQRQVIHKNSQVVEFVFDNLQPNHHFTCESGNNMLRLKLKEPKSRIIYANSSNEIKVFVLEFDKDEPRIKNVDCAQSDEACFDHSKLFFNKHTKELVDFNSKENCINIFNIHSFEFVKSFDIKKPKNAKRLFYNVEFWQFPNKPKEEKDNTGYFIISSGFVLEIRKFSDFTLVRNFEQFNERFFIDEERSQLNFTIGSYKGGCKTIWFDLRELKVVEGMVHKKKGLNNVYLKTRDWIVYEAKGKYFLSNLHVDKNFKLYNSENERYLIASEPSKFHFFQRANLLVASFPCQSDICQEGGDEIDGDSDMWNLTLENFLVAGDKNPKSQVTHVKKSDSCPMEFEKALDNKERFIVGLRFGHTITVFDTVKMKIVFELESKDFLHSIIVI